MLTRELLNNVLIDCNITDDGYFVISDDNKLISIFQDKSQFEPDIRINIHELAHKCKEWAYKNGWSICTTPHSIECYEKNTEKDIGRHNTKFRATADVNRFSLTPEYVFKACQWILSKQGLTCI